MTGWVENAPYPVRRGLIVGFHGTKADCFWPDHEADIYQYLDLAVDAIVIDRPKLALDLVASAH